MLTSICWCLFDKTRQLHSLTPVPLVADLSPNPKKSSLTNRMLREPLIED